MFVALRRYLITGMLVWVPLGVTILVIKLLVDLMDHSLVLLPPEYRPEVLLGFALPGIGALIVLLVVLTTGMLFANLFGRQILSGWESLLGRIPLVRSIYSAVKQLAETMFSDSGQSFRKVLLVEYPRKGLWTLAFQTGTDIGEAQEKTGEDVINIYVPTTPQPDLGLFIMVPKGDVIELEMSVDDGLKMILSMGAVVPEGHEHPVEVAQPPAKP